VRRPRPGRTSHRRPEPADERLDLPAVASGDGWTFTAGRITIGIPGLDERMRNRLFGSLAALAIFSANDSAAVPAPSPQGAASSVTLAAFDCTLGAEEAALVCTPLDGADGAIRLVFSDARYDRVDGAFRVDAAVQNLLGEPIGTVDGERPTGIRVVHRVEPTEQDCEAPEDGAIVARVANPDGCGGFATPDAPYFEYRQVLRTGETTAAKTWEWGMPRATWPIRFRLSVEAFRPGETALPPIPWNDFNFPSDTVAHPVTAPHPIVRYYRTVAGISFDSSATAATFARVLREYDAELIAGARGRGGHIVRLPDAGPEIGDVQARLDAIAAEPGVDHAYGLAWYRKTVLTLDPEIQDER
jgi:hypothetical protein